MRKRIGTIFVLFAVSLASCFLFTSLILAQEMPKVGEVIDKSNYKKYAHLFPPEFLGGFEDGWGGFAQNGIKVRFGEAKDYPALKKYEALSEKNRGKYVLDKRGLIEGGYNYAGAPFPGITPDDKDFAQKYMWNRYYRYAWFENWFATWYCPSKRMKEPVRYVALKTNQLTFGNRLFYPPAPVMKTPDNLYVAHVTQFTEPTSIKNLMTIYYDYLDPLRSGDAYTYIPTLRRAIRGESGIRSTPQQGTIWSIDDQDGFSGRVYEFTYKYLGERKVLAVTDSKVAESEFRKLAGVDIPWPDEVWSLVDCYIIEITAKDPTYPQGKKIIYVDKINSWSPYVFVWDRAGKLWKFIVEAYGADNSPPDGSILPMIQWSYGIDLQMGFGASAKTSTDNRKALGDKYEDYMISNVVKRVAH